MDAEKEHLMHLNFPWMEKKHDADLFFSKRKFIS